MTINSHLNYDIFINIIRHATDFQTMVNLTSTCKELRSIQKTKLYNNLLEEHVLFYFQPKVEEIDEDNIATWKSLTECLVLSVPFILKFKHKLSWMDTLQSYHYSEDFIREFQHRLSWKHVSQRKLSEDFIREFHKKVCWNHISTKQLSEQFIRDFHDKLDWIILSEKCKLSESTIREFNNKVYWKTVVKKQKLSENLIRDFSNNFDEHDWTCITYYQTLSVPFMREFHDKVDWSYVQTIQTLTENFIIEFKDKMLWPIILTHQSLSESFFNNFLLIKWTGVKEIQHEITHFLDGIRRITIMPYPYYDVYINGRRTRRY